MRDQRARTPRDVFVAEMEALLGLALHRGGDFADLYFEHKETSAPAAHDQHLHAGRARGLPTILVSALTVGGTQA